MARAAPSRQLMPTGSCALTRPPVTAFEAAEGCQSLTPFVSDPESPLRYRSRRLTGERWRRGSKSFSSAVAAPGHAEGACGSQGRAPGPGPWGRGQVLLPRDTPPGAERGVFQLAMQQAAQHAQMTSPVKAGELIKRCKQAAPGGRRQQFVPPPEFGGDGSCAVKLPGTKQLAFPIPLFYSLFFLRFETSCCHAFTPQQ